MEQLKRIPATLIFTAINITVFLLAQRTGDTRTIATLVAWGASARPLIWAGEYWRFVTPMFLHIGWMHLVWNTWAGFGWLREVELTLGSRRFALAYLMSGIAGTTFSLLGHDVVSAGASGASFGIIGTFLALRYRSSPSPQAFWATSQSLIYQLGFWFILGVVALPVDNYAHLGGLLCGGALGLAFTAAHGSRGKTVAVLAAVAVLMLAATRPLPWMKVRTEETTPGQ